MAMKSDEKIILYYNTDGDDIVDEKDGFVCASYERKQVGGDKENVDVFKVLFDRSGVLFGINSSQPSRNDRERFRLRRVNQECFEFYLRYLRTKSSSAWTAANRKAIE